MTVHVSTITKRCVIPVNNDCWATNKTDRRRVEDAITKGYETVYLAYRNSKIFSDCQRPCAYILECRSNDGKYLGVKVGSAANFQKRYQNIKISSGAKYEGVACLRPIACFPADIEQDEDLARYDAYSIENILHKFFWRYHAMAPVGNDYFISCGEENNNSIFLVQDLAKDTKTMRELSFYTENPLRKILVSAQTCREYYSDEIQYLLR